MRARRSDRLKERKKHTILPYLFAAAGWMLASATDHSLIQLLGIIMASTGSFTRHGHILDHAGSGD